MQSRRKHTVPLVTRSSGPCSCATITALLVSFTAHQVAPHFCHSLPCSPPPPCKAYVSSFPLFCSSAFCFCPFPLCYISVNKPEHFTSDGNILCSTSIQAAERGDWRGSRQKAWAWSRDMGGTIPSEGLKRRRGRINLGLAQGPDLG